MTERMDHGSAFGHPAIKVTSFVMAVFCVWLTGGMASADSTLAAITTQTEPMVAHFHHVHLNSVDPESAIRFYTSKFDCERAKFAGVEDAVWAQKSWLLFDKVSAPPASGQTSAIWHIGWGAEDMKATYQKQLDSGTKFFTPLSDISDLARVPGFFYAYVDGPDHALIELNTAAHHHFGHLHLFSDDPLSTGLWYIKYFGAVRRGGATAPPSRGPRYYKGFQVGPSMSLMVDNVNIIIFPAEHARQSYPDQWKGRTGFAPTAGRVIDHLAFSFDNLGEAVRRLRADGVTITGDIGDAYEGRMRRAFIEGPDKVRIELVEGSAHRD